MTKYSFIIPVFNCEKYLRGCVESIHRIARTDCEILLVDDGSTDGSGKLCDALAAQMPQVRCVHQVNGGVSKARNHGLESAVGEYVLFMDADDTIDSGKLGGLLSELDADPAIDMAVFGLRFDYYYKGRCYRRDEIAPAVCGVFSNGAWLAHLGELYRSNSLSPIWNKIVRRSIIMDNELRLREDMFFYEDMEFSLRVMACCGKILFSPEIVYLYRQAEDQGNAGRRLMRIPHLPELADQLESALDELTTRQNASVIGSQADSILLSLYLTWISEKQSVCSVAEMRIIRKEFSEWWRTHRLATTPEEETRVIRALTEKPIQVIAHRNYIKLRHGLAVRLKSAGILRRRT